MVHVKLIGPPAKSIKFIKYGNEKIFFKCQRDYSNPREKQETYKSGDLHKAFNKGGKKTVLNLQFFYVRFRAFTKSSRIPSLLKVL